MFSRASNGGAGTRERLDYDIDGVVLKIDDTRRVGAARGTSAASHAGRRPSSFPPQQRTTRLLRISRSTSDAPACSRRSPSWSRSSSAARPSRWRRCTTKATSGARTSAKGDTVDRPARGRSHPPGGGPGGQPAHGGRARVRDASRLPCVRDGASYATQRRPPTTARTAACPAQRVRLIEHFASRGAMDIEGLGERMALHALPGRTGAGRGRHLRPHRRAADGAAGPPPQGEGRGEPARVASRRAKRGPCQT